MEGDVLGEAWGGLELIVEMENGKLLLISEKPKVGQKGKSNHSILHASPTNKMYTDIT